MGELELIQAASYHFSHPALIYSFGLHCLIEGSGSVLPGDWASWVRRMCCRNAFAQHGTKETLSD